ncbi:hypothetical protein [Planococcus halocryophilus]|uniref:DUF7878 domain-containing protein n=1 Tax=Planococcus halocryophilus TaxID=1215089 RepID=UPI001F104797|nr:hypothetical protein [Planococcus halocryophilus]MCH4827931.1 hypothetical protein [Planococcus halocryophilus]
MVNLSINFELDPSLKLEKSLLRQKDAKLLIDVEGELKINIDQAVFFQEPSLALLELGVNLKKWRIRDSRGATNFYHVTMEHDEREGPILAFIQKNETEWYLFSIWQEFKHEDTISSEVLLGAVDRYLAELEEVLVKRFAIRYSDFIEL